MTSQLANEKATKYSKTAKKDTKIRSTPQKKIQPQQRQKPTNNNKKPRTNCLIEKAKFRQPNRSTDSNKPSIQNEPAAPKVAGPKGKPQCN